MSTRRRRSRRHLLAQQQQAAQQRALKEEAHRQWQARREVVNRYGKQRKDGQGVILCTPSRAELAGHAAMRASEGTTGKPAYPNREAAEAAARELEALGCKPLYAYRCGRSDSGHHHLTEDRARAGEIWRGARPRGAWQEAA